MRAEQHGRAPLGGDPADRARGSAAGRPGRDPASARRGIRPWARSRARGRCRAAGACRGCTSRSATDCARRGRPRPAATLATARAAGAALSVEAGVVAQVLLGGLALRIAGALRKDADASPDLGRARVRRCRRPRSSRASGRGSSSGRGSRSSCRPRSGRARRGSLRLCASKLRSADGDKPAVALLDAVSLDRCAHEPFRNDTSSLRSSGPLAVCSSTVPIPRT